MFRNVFSGLSLTRRSSNLLYTTAARASAPGPTVTHLSGACGLPADKAASVSGLFTAGGSGEAEPVFELLRSYGFTHAQLGSLISRNPSYLLADVEANLRPKLRYLVSIGISKSDLPRILCANKAILLKDLEKQIVPTFDFLRETLTSDEDFVYAVGVSSHLLGRNVRKFMVPNMATLRLRGVPERHIARLLASKPVTLMLRPDVFEFTVKRAEELGFQPRGMAYVLSLSALALQSKENWEKKEELLMRFGWLEDEFHSAFRLQPQMMLCSEAKLREMMEFFVHRLGLEPSKIASYPNLLLISLRRRALPRCSVFQVLRSKGLIEMLSATSISSGLNVSGKKFIRSYVTPFQGTIPEVVKAYEGEIEFSGFIDKIS